ncbi:MAG: AraC family ligand binding domain-containing protein [Tepidisphaeraceae bacterium]
MPPPDETPHRPAMSPVAGHFFTGPDYAVRRSAGTTDCLLIYTVAGGGRFTSADGRAFVTGPGDLVLIQPRTLHDYATPAGSSWELLWTHFVARADWADLLDWPGDWPGVGRLAGAAAVRPDFERLLTATLSADPLAGRRAMNAVEAVLLAAAGINPRRQSKLDPRVRLVIDHVATSFATPVTVETLAGVAGLSPSRLAQFIPAVDGAGGDAVRRRAADRAGRPTVADDAAEREAGGRRGRLRQPVLFLAALQSGNGKKSERIS